MRQVMDYSALDAIGKVAKEYKEDGKHLHLRYLREDCYRVLAKGRGMLKDVATWKVGPYPPLLFSLCSAFGPEITT